MSRYAGIAPGVMTPMIERQCRCRLQGLDRNTAAHLLDDRKLEQFADEEALIMLEVGDDDFKQVIDLTGDHVAGDNLRHRNDGGLESTGPVIGVTIDLDPDEHGEPRPTVLRRSIARYPSM